MVKVLIFAVMFLIVLAGCHKLCVPHQYAFNGGISIIYPDKDSIRVGDTLWFTSLIPQNLKYTDGSNSDSTNYNISGATNFNTDFHLTSPVGVGMQVGAIDSFDFLKVKGKLQSNTLDSSASKTISYIEENGNYIVSFGLIAQKKGVYFLIIIDIYQGMKKCDKFSVSIKMNNSDNHLHYLKDIYYGGGQLNSYDSTHTYCFKVY